ncbi:BPTI/Kunitz domain-containing protein-like [Choristoneura fumiferana]|uniref:BPTI/Kunitz domain-containing protein-like n=1 Tax=Choristoneura fumiferana TaxID=7141 RepID=UPI003D15BD4A
MELMLREQCVLIFIEISRCLYNLSVIQSNSSKKSFKNNITACDCTSKATRHKHRLGFFESTKNPYTRKICLDVERTLRARHKSCFLRPDTGPCRADIIQYYFDVKQKRCFRFFWGGCQGNGNRFETKNECYSKCHLNITNPDSEIPHFCSLAFDYGTCFGYYHRWTWDNIAKTCKRRLYSGCGGNQNNFQTRRECFANCVSPPNNTFNKHNQYTTCIPYIIPGVS